MKIEQTESFAANDMMNIVEPITVQDITVEWRSDDHISLSGGSVNISAKVDLDQAISDKCAELFGTNYQGLGHGGFVGFYVNTAEMSCHAYVSITEDVSMRGVRKDRQAAKKEKAIAKLKARATQSERDLAVNEFLGRVNKALQEMVDSRNESTMRDSHTRISGGSLSSWADEQDETIEQDQSEISKLYEKIKALKVEVRTKRINILSKFIEDKGDEYDSRVIDMVRETIEKREVFSESRFG